MREKLINLLSTAGWNLFADGLQSKKQIADHLISNGVTIPVHCKSCSHYDPSGIRPYCGWCNIWGSTVRESGFCHEADPKEEVTKKQLSSLYGRMENPSREVEFDYAAED